MKKRKEEEVVFKINYKGLHDIFVETYRKGVRTVVLSIDNLTLETAELISLVVSEYLYIIVDSRTIGSTTEIFLASTV